MLPATVLTRARVPYDDVDRVVLAGCIEEMVARHINMHAYGDFMMVKSYKRVNVRSI